MLDFPSAPANNQIYQAAGASYQWTGTKWRRTNVFESSLITEFTSVSAQSADDISIDPAKHDYVSIAIPYNAEPTIELPVASPHSSVVLELNRKLLDLGYSLGYPSFSVAAQDTSPSGIHFKPDGTKMYVIGYASDRAHQYTLSTAWDLSTASYDNVSFSVSAQDGIPQGIHFKPDGTKMYMVGRSSDSVYSYTLSTAWDLSTASFDSVSFDVSAQDTSPSGIHFKPDGTKMYMVGYDNDRVYSYTLSTAWDLSTASFDSVSFSVAAQDTRPSGIHFKPDGTKMYVIGYASDRAHQYTLSTAWDLSTASYDNVSFSVSAQDTIPQGIHFKPDGTKMYMVGFSSDSVYSYTLSTAWDISTVFDQIPSYDNVSFSVSAQDTIPQGIHFKPDGTKMYMVGFSSDSVHQYTLSTAWDISTASYDSVSFDVSAQDTGPQGIHFKPDGTKMYMVGYGNDRVHSYTLSTAWDISTASYDSVSFSVAAQEATPRGIHFKPDGIKMYIVGSASDSVYSYTLSTAWDISTASYDSVSFDFAAQDTGPQGIHFKPDGTKMYIVGDTGDNVYSYTLSTAWDISTASYDDVSFDVSAQDVDPRSIHFKPDGTKMYMVGNGSDSVHQYSTGVAFAPTISWGINIQWESGTAPQLDFEYSNNVLIQFVTYDGSFWIGSPLSTDLRST